jgi:hypothetical protein
VNAPSANSLCHLVERLGPLVDSGSLDKETAVQWVFEFSDGGLTRYGSASLLASWSTLRGSLLEGITQTKALLARLDGAA